MSHWLDLDEYKEEDLKAELARRQQDRDKGLCDYCHRSSLSPSCKFPERHHAGAVTATILSPTVTTTCGSCGQLSPPNTCTPQKCSVLEGG